MTGNNESTQTKNVTQNITNLEITENTAIGEEIANFAKNLVNDLKLALGKEKVAIKEKILSVQENEQISLENIQTNVVKNLEETLNKVTETLEEMKLRLQSLEGQNEMEVDEEQGESITEEVTPINGENLVETEN